MNLTISISIHLGEDGQVRIGGRRLGQRTYRRTEGHVGEVAYKLVSDCDSGLLFGPWMYEKPLLVTWLLTGRLDTGLGLYGRS